ncbi:MAG: acyltransferase [Clostridia bacterium]|nr:acyltransferase [Clostridia bacterium]
MEKNYGLNYIRGVGAILIMLYHYTTRYFDSLYNMGAESSHVGVWWGCWAVSVFFILSGFLTVANVNDTLTPKKFAVKRVTRLYPSYWVAIILTTIVTYALNFPFKTDLVSTIFNFTMLQGFVGIPSVDGAYWTLRCELWFYVIITLTLFLKKRNYTILSTIWLVLIILQDGLFAALGIDGALDTIAKLILLSDWASAFIIGMSFCAIYKNKKDYLAYVNLLLCFAIEYTQRPLNRFIFTIFIAALIYILIVKRIKFKYDGILNFFASISFPLYLIHQKIGYNIIQKMENRGGGQPFGVALAIGTSIALAYLVHKFVEIPASKRLQTKLLKAKKD